MLAILLIIGLFPTIPVYADQEIYEIDFPLTVNSGEQFNASIKVRYNFGERNVRIWSILRDPSTREVIAIPIEPSQNVTGEGEIEWHIQMTMLSGGLAQLEASALHWDNERQVTDYTESFELVVDASRGEAVVEITEIQAVMPPETIGVGETTTVNVSITYKNLVKDARLQIEIFDKDSGKKLRYVISEHLSAYGNFTFRPLYIRPEKTGEWNLQIKIKPCTTGLCALEVMAEETFTIWVGGQPPESKFDFTLTANPSIQLSKSKETLLFNIYVELEGGDPEQITLNLSHPIKDMTYYFDPSTGNPSFNSKLTINIPEKASSGLYPLEIIADGGGLIRTTTIELVIEPTQEPETTVQTSPTPETPEITSQKSDWTNILIISMISILIVSLLTGLYFKRKKAVNEK